LIIDRASQIQHQEKNPTNPQTDHHKTGAVKAVPAFFITAKQADSNRPE
jgi:hypothetical protein